MPLSDILHNIQILSYPSLCVNNKLHLIGGVTIPPPRIHQLLQNHFNLGRWSSSGSDRGIAHFLTAQEIQSRKWEERTRTNKGLGWLKCKKGDSVTLCIPLCMCSLTLAWVSSEISTKLLGMPTHLDRSSLTAAGLSLSLSLMRLVSQMSGVDSQPPLCVSRRQLTFPGSFFQLSDWRSLPTSGRVEILSPNPLSGFAPKQTKESSAWRTTYIVLQRLWYWILENVKYLFTSHSSRVGYDTRSILSGV